MAKQEKIIIDSDVLFEFYKGNEEVSAAFYRIGLSNLCISVITYGEAVFGTQNKTELTKWKKQLEKFSLLQIDEYTCHLFVSIMNNYTLSHKSAIADSFIAATALRYKIKLYTNNKKDFSFIKGLELYR